MNRFREWLRNLFTRPEIEPFIAEEDATVQRFRDAADASRERQHQRREPHWYEHELLQRAPRAGRLDDA